MAKSYNDRVKAIVALQPKLWKVAEEKCKKQKGKKVFAYTEEIYRRMASDRRKNRKVWDKRLLCFKLNIGTKEDPTWDFAITAEMILSEAPVRDKVFRTVKMMIDKENKPETYADVLRFRPDWLIPDSLGQWGTDESIKFSIASCIHNLEKLSVKLKALGFEEMNFTENLQEENRTGLSTETLISKLDSLGLKRSTGEQLSLL